MEKKIDYKLLAILLITILSRTILLGACPGGIHADEAFAGYEAYSMANFGTDSWGYTFPVYLSVWGSGMSVLESYLMIPFIALWGLNSVTVKIPQMILGILTIYIFFLLLKKILNRNIAYWGAFLLAISPWHIMMSRFGMDCNITPAFILLGIYFAIYSFEKPVYLLISAMFWGLSLYAYAVNWLFVPIFLVGCFVYCMIYKKIFFSRNLILAGVILVSSAMPLILFIAVNEGMIPEIVTPFISIPKLAVYRGSEITVSYIIIYMKKLIRLFFAQNDHSPWNVIKGFGIYYIYSTPFVIYGIYIVIKQFIKNIKQNEFSYGFIILWWFLSGIVVALLQGVGINRLNMIHPVMFIFLAIALDTICKKWGKKVKYSLVTLYLVSFLLFETFYFTTFQKQISNIQHAGLKEALTYAQEVSQDEQKIYVANSIRHSQVLFYLQYPTTDYLDTVEWSVEDGVREVVIHGFGPFLWEWSDDLSEAGVYVIVADDAELYKEHGYNVTLFHNCAVAVK